MQSLQGSSHVLKSLCWTWGSEDSQCFLQNSTGRPELSDNEYVGRARLDLQQGRAVTARQSRESLHGIQWPTRAAHSVYTKRVSLDFCPRSHTLHSNCVDSARAIEKKIASLPTSRLHRSGGNPDMRVTSSRTVCHNMRPSRSEQTAEMKVLAEVGTGRPLERSLRSASEPFSDHAGRGAGHCQPAGDRRHLDFTQTEYSTVHACTCFKRLGCQECLPQDTPYLYIPLFINSTDVGSFCRGGIL